MAKDECDFISETPTTRNVQHTETGDTWRVKPHHKDEGEAQRYYVETGEGHTHRIIAGDLSLEEANQIAHSSASTKPTVTTKEEKEVCHCGMLMRDHTPQNSNHDPRSMDDGYPLSGGVETKTDEEIAKNSVKELLKAAPVFITLGHRLGIQGEEFMKQAFLSAIRESRAQKQL